MKHYILPAVILVLGLSILSSPAFAQKYEINPYAGGFFTDQTEFGKLKSEGLYGVRGGYFLSKNIEVEGNLGYINHFKLQDPDGKTRAWIWEGLGAYNFNTFGNRFQPYASAGIGGVTARNSALRDTASSNPVIEGGDTFFAFSYGAGVKSNRLWGPVGLRAEVRGRTLPNFFGTTTTFLEATGGINLTWGER